MWVHSETSTIVYPARSRTKKTEHQLLDMWEASPSPWKWKRKWVKGS
jgi:hypothetical protein